MMHDHSESSAPSPSACAVTSWKSLYRGLSVGVSSSCSKVAFSSLTPSHARVRKSSTVVDGAQTPSTVLKI